MTVVLGIIGLIVGLTLGKWQSALFGALLGIMAGELVSVRFRLRQVEQALLEWQQYFRQRESKESSLSHSDSKAEPVHEVVSETTAFQVEPQEAANDSIESAIESVTDEAIDALPSSHSRAFTQSATSSQLEADVQGDQSVADQYQPVPFESRLIGWIRNFLIGGNTLVRVGILVLFFGVAFLLQYTAEHVRVPIQLRLLGVVLAAIVFLGLGWRLRQRRAGFALALQGGAIGVLYLVIFAAWRLYHLLDPTFAFALLLAIVLLSGALAILQNSIWLAVLGISGGFLAPILTSTGNGSHIALFSFYAVLNVGVLLIAWFKSWRVLNVLGFAFTFIIGIVWGVLSYRSELFASTEPFLILFFLFYVAIALLYALKQSVQIRHYVDGTLIFGLPIVAFGLQAAMLRDQRFQLAGSAVAVAMFYLSLAKVLWRRTGLRLLVESFLALAITFATLAIPLACNGRWSGATWALEGAALVWVGARQSRLLPRISGVALQALAAVLFLQDRGFWFEGWPILNSACLGAVLIGVAGIVSSEVFYRYAKSNQPWEQVLAPLGFWWGLCWWFAAGNGEIQRSLGHEWRAHANLAYLVSLAVISSVLCSWRQIRVAAIAAWLLLPVMVLIAGYDWIESVAPIAYAGWVIWPVALGVWYWLLKRHETTETFSAHAQGVGHVFSGWLLLFVATRELFIQLSSFLSVSSPFDPLQMDSVVIHTLWSDNAWLMSTLALLPALYLASCSRLKSWFEWPVAKHAPAYLANIGSGVVVWLLLWSVFTAVLNDGSAAPLPYVPILNPIDLMQLFVLLAMLIWRRRISKLQTQDVTVFGASSDVRQFYGVLGVISFVWLNAALMRTLHHGYGIAYEVNHLWHSVLVQTSLSIFWTVIALTSMWLATRKGWRVLWFVGAVLMGVELLKLFFVDLSNSGSVARIISFLGVGLLVVLIGYVAPLPPQMNEDDTDVSKGPAR